MSHIHAPMYARAHTHTHHSITSPYFIFIIALPLWNHHSLTSKIYSSPFMFQMTVITIKNVSLKSIMNANVFKKGFSKMRNLPLLFSDIHLRQLPKWWAMMFWYLHHTDKQYDRRDRGCVTREWHTRHSVPRSSPHLIPPSVIKFW